MDPDLILGSSRSEHLDGWTQGTDASPSFGTHRGAMLLRMRLFVHCGSNMASKLHLRHLLHGAPVVAEIEELSR